MARIRTIKPEYFRHELLQDLQSSNPSLNPMLVFAGLWTQCDKNGVFEYKPRQLKLDILPFIEFDLGASLVLLREAKLISLMLHGEKVYGFVPTFKDHQRINGKEAQSQSVHPQPSEMIEYKQEGSNGEAAGKQPRSQEGKGKEGKGKEISPEALRLSGLLSDLILKNNPGNIQLSGSKKELTTQRWAMEIEKINRIDAQTWQQIEYVIVWCQSNPFWKANILSGQTLRAQYDKLVAKIKADNEISTPKERVRRFEL